MKKLLSFILVFGFVTIINIGFLYAQAPANDNPCSAQTLTPGAGCTPTAGTNVNATNSVGVPAPGCGVGGGIQDVWYQVTVPASGSLTLTTAAGSVTDMCMAVYSGTCGSLSLVACNDDAIGLMPQINLTGQTPGATLWIMMWDYGNSQQGTFTICATSVASSGPCVGGSNNNCATADPFCTGTAYNYCNSTGVASMGTYDCLFTTPNPMWMYLNIATSGSLQIQMNQYNNSNVGVDVDFALYGPYTSVSSGCAVIGPGTPAVSCSYSTSYTETATIPSAVAGEWYILLITNFSNQAGYIQFSQTGGTGTTNCSIMVPCSSSVAGTNVTCNGLNNGSILVTANGGTANYNVSWVGPSSGNPGGPEISTTGGTYNITGLSPGSYTVTMTDNTGCTSTNAVTITQPAVYTTSASNTGPYCVGQTIQLNAGAGATSYSWSGPGGYTNATQNPTRPGSTTAMGGIYTVTATDASGCTATATTTVTVNPLPTATISATTPICAGSSATLTASGGGTYSWNTGATTAAISVTPGATTTYTVTVTSAAGCTSTTTVTQVVNPLPTPTATNTGPYCAGTTIQLNSTGGTSYSWSGPLGYTNATQNPTRPGSTAAMAGVYTVTVTNASGCTATATTTVVVNAVPVAIINPTTPICAGSSATLTASGGGTYSWNTGATTAAITVTPGATTTYTVTVTGAGGCTSTTTITQVVNPLPTPTASNTGPYCAGTTIQLNSTGGGTYSWSGPGGYTNATQNPTRPGSTVAMAGVYTVTVTSASGCTATATTTVVVNAVPVAGINPTTPICAGNSATLTATGGGTYLWNTGATTAAITVTPGVTTTYTVTITGAGGCTSTTTATQVVNPLPTPSIGATTPICAGSSATLTASGGGTYSWNTGATTASITVTPGATTTYTVTVTSAAGCTSTTTATQVVNPLPTPTASNTGPYCAGITIQLNSTGGTSYSWSGPGGYTNATQNPTRPGSTVAMAGVYTVTVTSASGCTATATTTVTVNPLPTATISATTPICAGSSATLTASGGGTYSWNTGATTAAITVTPGATTTYTVTVTGVGGCTSTTSATQVVNPLPTPSIGATTPICAGSSATLTATGGGTYSWNTGATTASITVTPGATTTYTVTVTSASGCTSTTTSTQVVNPLPTPTATNTGPYCPGTTIQLNSTGGTSYSWSGPGFTNTTQNPTIPSAGAGNAGIYTVTVTNASGCTATGTTTVSVSGTLAVTAGSNSPVCTNQALNLTSTLVAGGTYAWSGPGGYSNTTQNPTISPATAVNGGVYTVTITNASGCTGTATVTATINPLPTAGINPTTPICIGSSATLTATGGGTYSWNTGATTASTTVSPGATTTYTVTVTSAAGCTSTTTVTQVVNPLPTPGINPTTPICTGSSANLTAIGGGTYAWNTGATTANITVTPGATTTYTVTVTSASGCTSSTTATQVVNPLPTPTINPTTAICAGSSATLTANGGGTYAWNTGATTANTTVSPGATTTYTVTVTNATGCTSTTTVTQVVNPLPTPGINPTTPICTGASATLTATGGGNYSWNTGATTATTTVSPGATTTYTVTVTSAAGCTSSTSAIQVVNPLPTPSASNTGAYCAGQSIQLNSTGGTSYSWSGPLGYTNGTQNPTIASSTVAMSGTYTVTVTDANGCTSSTTTVVTVNTLPAPTASNTGPYCAGSTIQLNSTGGGTYAWAGPAGYTNGTQNPTISLSTVAMNGTYTVTVTLGGGCTGSATTAVTVNALPVPTASNTGPYCAGSTIQLNSTGGTSYSWNGPSAYSNSTQNPSIVSSTSGMTGTYTVTVTDAAGCTSTTTTNVSVNALPIPTASNTGPYCAGLTIQLNSTGGTSYSWSGPLGYTNATQNPTIGGSTAAMSGTYTVTATNAAGCNSTMTTVVTVNALPTPTASNTGPYCAGLTIQLNSTGGTNYSWSGPLGYTNATQNPTIVLSATGMTGTYSVTVTDMNGCSATATTNVVVNGPPTPTANNTGPYCAGATIQLNSPTGSATDDWNGPGGYTSTNTQNPTIAASTTAMSGIYTVTVTDINGCFATATTTVAVNALPTPTANNTGPYCAGATIQLNSPTGSATDDWSGPGGYTSTNTQNTFIAGSTVAMSGIYTVSVTDVNGCNATATTNVVVNALPTPTANNTGPYCAGATIQLNSPTGSATDDWTGPLAYSQNDTQNPTIIASTVTMSGTYTVTVTDINGCVATTTTNVVVNGPPTPTANNTGPYCAGATIQLNSPTGSATDDWSGPGGYTSTNTQNPTIAASTVAMSGIYSVTVTDINGCFATATTTVTVNALPTPTANNTGPYCAGSTIQLNSPTGSATDDWTGPSAYVQNNMQNPNIAGSTVAMSGIYTVSVTDVNGCNATATTNVVVNALPTPVANNTGPYCDGNTMSLTSAGGVDYDWAGPGGFSLLNTQNGSLPNANPGMSGIYTVTVTDGNGCVATANTNVTINSLPAAFAGNNTPICELQNVNFNSSGGVVYDWTGPGGYNVPNTQNPTIITAPMASAGTYTVTVTDGNGCISTASTVVVINPNLVFTGGSNSPICEGTQLDLTAQNIPGATYDWVGPNSFDVLNTENPSIPGSTIAATGTYTVTATNAVGCTGTATVVVQINSIPTPMFSGNPLNGCAPTCANFTDQSTVVGSTIAAWNWNIETQAAASTQNANYCFNNPGSYDVSLTVTSAAGCSAILSFIDFINISGNPLADFLYTPIEITIVKPEVIFANTSVGAVSYVWDFGDGNNSIATSPIHTYNDTGYFCPTLTATNTMGCWDTAVYCLHVKPEYSLFIPNSFTVNDDGLNDIWTVIGMNIKTIEVRIYDRWGEELYFFDNIDKGWNGTRQNGNYCKQDVYVYRIEVVDGNNDYHEIIGNVNLIR